MFRYSWVFVGPSIVEPIEIEIEKGKTLKVKVLAISNLRPGAIREVFFELNGQLRSIMVQDKSASKNVKSHPKALK
jgi:pyruvate carboxylase